LGSRGPGFAGPLDDFFRDDSLDSVIFTGESRTDASASGLF
jgi:hypothetical protein